MGRNVVEPTVKQTETWLRIPKGLCKCGACDEPTVIGHIVKIGNLTTTCEAYCEDHSPAVFVKPPLSQRIQ